MAEALFVGTAVSRLKATAKINKNPTLTNLQFALYEQFVELIGVSSLKAEARLNKNPTVTNLQFAFYDQFVELIGVTYLRADATAYPTASLSAKLSGVTTLTAFGGVPLYASAKLRGVSYGKFVGTWYERETAPSSMELVDGGINIKPVGGKITVKALDGNINVKKHKVR